MQSITKKRKLPREDYSLSRSMKWAQNLQLTITQVLFILMFVVVFTEAKESNGVVMPQQFTVMQINMKPTVPVTYRSVGKGYRSGVRAPMQIVVRSQNEWSALWRQHAVNDPSSRPAPAVDFDKEVVVALFLGEKPTGGYDVQISRAEQTQDGLTIYYREKSPLPGGMVTQALTQPFHIVRIIGEVNSEVIFRRE